MVEGIIAYSQHAVVVNGPSNGANGINYASHFISF